MARRTCSTHHPSLPARPLACPAATRATSQPTNACMLQSVCPQHEYMSSWYGDCTQEGSHGRQGCTCPDATGALCQQGAGVVPASPLAIVLFIVLLDDGGRGVGREARHSTVRRWSGAVLEGGGGRAQGLGGAQAQRPGQRPKFVFDRMCWRAWCWWRAGGRGVEIWGEGWLAGGGRRQRGCAGVAGGGVPAGGALRVLASRRCAVAHAPLLAFPPPARAAAFINTLAAACCCVTYVSQSHRPCKVEFILERGATDRRGEREREHRGGECTKRNRCSLARRCKRNRRGLRCGRRAAPAAARRRRQLRAALLVANLPVLYLAVAAAVCSTLMHRSRGGVGTGTRV